LQQQHHHQLQHSNETESLQDSIEPSLREMQNLKQAALLVCYTCLLFLPLVL
jgi:hypothetical protein